jgi:hypothetical protein
MDVKLNLTLDVAMQPPLHLATTPSRRVRRRCKSEVLSFCHLCRLPSPNTSDHRHATTSPTNARIIFLLASFLRIGPGPMLDACSWPSMF